MEGGDGMQYRVGKSLPVFLYLDIQCCTPAPKMSLSMNVRTDIQASVSHTYMVKCCYVLRAPF